MLYMRIDGIFFNEIYLSQLGCDPCDGFECPEGQECQKNVIRCIKAPCPEKPGCVPIKASKLFYSFYLSLSYHSVFRIYHISVARFVFILF